MAVRKFSNTNDLVMTVKLKNGDIFEGCDITQKPFGEHEHVVSVWINDILRVLPMSEIEYCELYKQIPCNEGDQS